MKNHLIHISIALTTLATTNCEIGEHSQAPGKLASEDPAGDGICDPPGDNICYNSGSHCKDGYDCDDVGDMPPGPPLEDDDQSKGTKKSAVCTITSAATGFAVGATINFLTSTGGCIGGTLVTVYGELLCAIPAAGTILSGVGATLAGGIAWASCKDWSGAVTTFEGSSDWANDCAEGGTNYCENLTGKNGKYKRACGPQQFDFGQGGLLSCKNPFLNCDGMREMLIRSASCERGRMLAKNQCYGGTWDGGHQQAFDHADIIKKDCITEYNNNCYGKPGHDETAQKISKDSRTTFVNEAKLCR